MFRGGQFFFINKDPRMSEYRTPFMPRVESIDDFFIETLAEFVKSKRMFYSMCLPNGMQAKIMEGKKGVIVRKVTGYDIVRSRTLMRYDLVFKYRKRLIQFGADFIEPVAKEHIFETAKALASIVNKPRYVKEKPL